MIEREIGQLGKKHFSRQLIIYCPFLFYFCFLRTFTMTTLSKFIRCFTKKHWFLFSFCCNIDKCLHREAELCYSHLHESIDFFSPLSWSTSVFNGVSDWHNMFFLPVVKLCIVNIHVTLFKMLCCVLWPGDLYINKMQKWWKLLRAFSWSLRNVD